MTGGVVDENGICPRAPGQFQCAQPTKTLDKRLLDLDYKWAEIELCARYIILTTQP
jgi:hypothetical protein